MIAYKRRILFILQGATSERNEHAWRKAVALAQNGYAVSLIHPKGTLSCDKADVPADVAKYLTALPYGFSYTATTPVGHFFEYISLLIWQYMYVLRVFLASGFDALHLCNAPDSIFLIGRFFRFFFRKRILVDHAIPTPELHSVHYPRKSVFYKITCWFESKLFQSADIVLVPDEKLREIALTRGGMASGKIFIVRPGGGKRTAAPSSTGRKTPFCQVAYLRESGLPAADGLFLEIVRLVTLDRQREDIRFTVTAGQADIVLLKKHAALTGILEHIRFETAENAGEKLKYVQKADIILAPGDDTGWARLHTPDMLPDALREGKPIVQCDGSEGRFLCGEASLYAPYGDRDAFAEHILLLVDNPALRREMGEAGKQRFERIFAGEQQTHALLAAYEELFSGVKHLVSSLPEEE